MNDNEPESNGAREALARYFAADFPPPVQLSREDHLLIWLYVEGYKVVPVEQDEDGG